MKGNIQLIRNYGNDRELMFSDNNMAVDGMRKTIADVMTYMPDPSSVAGGTAYLEPGIVTGKHKLPVISIIPY